MQNKNKTQQQQTSLVVFIEDFAMSLSGHCGDAARVIGR